MTNIEGAVSGCAHSTNWVDVTLCMDGIVRTPGRGCMGKPGGPWPPTAQEAVTGSLMGLKTSPKTDALPLEAWEGQNQGWSLRKGPWHSDLIPQLDTVCLLTRKAMTCLVLYGLGVCRMILRRSGERDERGLICILNQQLYSLWLFGRVWRKDIFPVQNALYNQEGKKLHNFRRATFSFVTSASSLTTPSPSLPQQDVS